MDNVQVIVIISVIVLLCICSSVSVYFMTSKKAIVTTPPPILPPPTLPPIEMTTQSIMSGRKTSSPMASEKLPKIINDINNKFSWQSMQNVGIRDISELGFIRQCDRPWGAMYQIGCTVDGITQKSQIFGPISSNNQQSPILRVGDYDQTNLCAKLGGELSVYRRRPQDKNMKDITLNLTDITNSQPYNKKDALFIDDYKSDC
jgi:hypothetical protein